MASSFWILSNSAGIPSPPLALFVVLLPNVHLMSQSRMSGSRWVTTPLWLSWSLRSFLYSYSVHSFHLFLISSSSSVRSFLSFIVPILAWKFPLISLIFLRKALVFLLLFLSSISLYCSFNKAHLGYGYYSGIDNIPEKSTHMLQRIRN